MKINTHAGLNVHYFMEDKEAEDFVEEITKIDGVTVTLLAPVYITQAVVALCDIKNFLDGG